MNTLAERVMRNFSRIKIKKASIRVPKLRVRKQNIPMPKKTETPISSIVRIIIKNAEEEAKKIVKEESDNESDDDTSVISPKDEKSQAIGGYGTISRNYGAAPQKSYVDYDKIFSYLGKFRANGAYKPLNDSNSQNNGDKGFSLISSETMDQGTRHIKYLRPSTREFGVGAGGIDAMSMVPIGGMDSAEWEEFKLWFQLDKVAYYLKRKMA